MHEDLLCKQSCLFFKIKKACALEPKSKKFHSKILPLSKALEEGKKHRLPLQKKLQLLTLEIT
jgi:hypothetical protein